MLGDAYDFLKLLRSAEIFTIGRFDDAGDVIEDPFPCPTEIRRKVVTAAYTLLAAFISAEKTFRTMHGLTIKPKYARKVSLVLA